MTTQDLANDPGTNWSIKTKSISFKPDSFGSDLVVARFLAQFHLTICGEKWVNHNFIIQKYLTETTMYRNILIGGMQNWEWRLNYIMSIHDLIVKHVLDILNI